MLSDAGRFDEALAILDEALGLAPSMNYLQLSRAVVLAYMGRREESLAALREWKEDPEDESFKLYARGIVHATLGEPHEATRLLEEIEKSPDSEQTLAACVAAGIGDRDRALPCSSGRWTEESGRF